MNILLVSRCYPPSIGGVQTLVHQVGHELAKRNRVAVAATNFRESRLPLRLMTLQGNLLARAHDSFVDEEVSVTAMTPNWADRLRMAPIALKTIPKLPRVLFHHFDGIGYTCFSRTYFERMRRVVSGVDLVHGFGGYYLGWTAQAAAHSLNVPFVCTSVVHPKESGDDDKSVLYYRRCQAVIALLEAERQYLVSLGVPAEKVHVIAVSSTANRAAAGDDFRIRHHLQGKPLVLYIGRMMPRKGAKALLSAAPLVWQRLPSVHFVFIGPAVANSRKWFVEVDTRIIHLGEVSESEKANALAACDIFCMPSDSESFGIAFLEAWSFGKPVIGSRAYGSVELIEENGAGIVVDQDPHTIAEAIVRLGKQPELARSLGDRGRALVEQKYDIRNQVLQLEGLYRDVINRGLPE